jgi:hypothetical protein
MDHRGETIPDPHERRDPVLYEPPRVERILTPAELEREVLYAGDTTGPVT